MDWLMGKGKKKEKEVASTEDTRPWLDADWSQSWVECARNPDSCKPPVLLNAHVLAHLVDLPAGLELEEWMATHTVAFFNLTNNLCSVTAEYCTESTCPVMCVPGSTVSWVDDKGKKSKHSAPVYISMVMSSIECMIQDETVFPTKYGQGFGLALEASVRRVSRLLLQVLLHLLHSHFRLLVSVQLHSQLNSLLAHLHAFGQRYSVLEEKDWEPLADLLQLWGVARGASFSDAGSRRESPALHEQLPEQFAKRDRSASPAVTSLRSQSAASEASDP